MASMTSPIQIHLTKTTKNGKSYKFDLGTINKDLAIEIMFCHNV